MSSVAPFRRTALVEALPAFRRGRLAEFLEARIIPERIEHRIEPEHRGSEPGSCPKKFALLFRRERRDDFLEARIAAERVPEQMQL
jgi:hypothetical protein